MVKTAKIVTCIYLVWVLSVIVGSQSKRASGLYTPDTTEAKKLGSVQQLGGATPLPVGWTLEIYGPEHYRKKLAKRTAKLIALPMETHKATEKAERLAIRNSVAPIDDVLFTLTSRSDKAHSNANRKVRAARVAGGVPLGSSYRGSGYSGHK